MPMNRLVAAVALGMVVHGSAASAQEKPVNPQAAVLADFKDRVDKYVDLRKKADDSAPAQKKTPEPSEIKDAQHALGERVGVARKGARQGDIFSPEISAHFRRLLRLEVKSAG